MSSDAPRKQPRRKSGSAVALTTNPGSQSAVRFVGIVVESKVFYHLQTETGWYLVCSNGKQKLPNGKFSWDWRLPFTQWAISELLSVSVSK